MNGLNENKYKWYYYWKILCSKLLNMDNIKEIIMYYVTKI